jgi:hypothetical protein
MLCGIDGEKRESAFPGSFGWEWEGTERPLICIVPAAR